MVMGPDLFYKCPACGMILKNRSYLSGNTFGAVFYSDGNRNAPMLPDVPNLTKCPACGAILWLSDLQELDEKKKPNSAEENERENVPHVKHLELADLYRALYENSSYENRTEKKQREREIRKRIWWNYNRSPDIKKNEEKAWRENCFAFLELLNIANNDQRCMAAELYRNLGDFSQSLELVRTLPEKYNTFRLMTMEACCLAKTQTFTLNEKNCPEEEVSYDIFQNSANELLFSISEYEGEPDNPQLVYNGGEAALLYRSQNSAVILDKLNPDAPEPLKNARQVLVVECDRSVKPEEIVVREYFAKVTTQYEKARYLISVNFTESGPFTIEQLAELAKERKFTWDYYIIKTGESKWRRAWEADEIKNILEKNLVLESGDTGPLGGMVFFIDRGNEHRIMEAAAQNLGPAPKQDAARLCAEYRVDAPDSVENWYLPNDDELCAFARGCDLPKAADLLRRYGAKKQGGEQI